MYPLPVHFSISYLLGRIPLYTTICQYYVMFGWLGCRSMKKGGLRRQKESCGPVTTMVSFCKRFYRKWKAFVRNFATNEAMKSHYCPSCHSHARPWHNGAVLLGAMQTFLALSLHQPWLQIINLDLL